MMVFHILNGAKNGGMSGSHHNFPLLQMRSAIIGVNAYAPRIAEKSILKTMPCPDEIKNDNGKNIKRTKNKVIAYIIP